MRRERRKAENGVEEERKREDNTCRGVQRQMK
jgi:hypothetical protein